MYHQKGNGYGGNPRGPPGGLPQPITSRATAGGDGLGASHCGQHRAPFPSAPFMSSRNGHDRKKWLEDNSGLRMRQCQSGLEQVQGEIKITREAIVRFQEGVEKVKGDQQYLGLKAIGAQGEMQRIHNKTDWLATSVGHTQKYGNGAAEGTGPRALPHGSRSATG